MADRLNPAERTAAESDYEKKFNKTAGQADADDDLKEKEATPDATWKTNTNKKLADTKPTDTKKKARFRFLGRQAGKLRGGSAFAFLLGFLLLAVVYTAVFSPNIILVNIKEMYTNDLSDATAALNDYYWKMMNYKIGKSQCSSSGDQNNPEGDIKCKLSTMSRAQYKAFEKAGFTVFGQKVKEDNLDDGQPDNDLPESRYEVTAILPPKYQSIINSIKGSGTSILTSVASGNLSGISNQLSGALTDAQQSLMSGDAQDMLNYMPIAGGDMLWLYSQLSDTNRDQVYSVFNPITGFYHDAEFANRLKSKYDLTQNTVLGGQNELEVDASFDAAMHDGGGGIDPVSGQPSSSGGINLSSFASTGAIASLETALNTMTATATSYGGLQCDWYSFGKLVMDDAAQAKAASLARFAMMYLNGADAVKAGTSNEQVTSMLSDNLSQSMGGGFNGQNATDSSMYKSIVYNNLPVPSIYGFLYAQSGFDLIGAFMPAWTQLMASATAEGAASNLSGSLVEPPADLNGNNRDYCLGAETTQNAEAIKTNTETKCAPQITAEAPPGWQSALEAQIALGRSSCVVHHYDDQDHVEEGTDIATPTIQATSLELSPYVAGLFGATALAWSTPLSLLFSSQTKGVAASDALFAGTGELMGDMAMSRGMEPANVATLGIYLAQEKGVQQQQEDMAREQAKKQPFDVYNQYSFIGSIVHSLSPTYSDQTPLFSSLANSLSMVGSGLKQLNSIADAKFDLQPDAFNPLRLSCPNISYLSIEITADTLCNVRYSMGPQELAADPDSVINYMEQSHSDLTQDNVNELQERMAKADQLDGDLLQVTRMYTAAKTAADQPEIDKTTGKAIPNSEYSKFLTYCVNRQAPWGSSDIVMANINPTNIANIPNSTNIPNLSSIPGLSSLLGTSNVTNLNSAIKTLTGTGATSTSGMNAPTTGLNIPVPAVTEGAKADQDWYTGKKCTEQSEELMNFRAYTMMCSVDGSLAGTTDCTQPDDAPDASYGDSFYTSNYIEFQGW